MIRAASRQWSGSCSNRSFAPWRFDNLSHARKGLSMSGAATSSHRFPGVESRGRQGGRQVRRLSCPPRRGRSSTPRGLRTVRYLSSWQQWRRTRRGLPSSRHRKSRAGRVGFGSSPRATSGTILDLPGRRPPKRSLPLWWSQSQPRPPWCRAGGVGSDPTLLLLLLPSPPLRNLS